MPTDVPPVFETTYAPEISIFTPVQPVRDTTTPSPTWPRSPPSTLGGLPSRANPATAVPNGVTEEATVQPVSRTGRGARLSFLGGRKKDHVPKEVSGVADPIHEEEPPSATKSNASHSAKDTTTAPSGNRRSFFRTIPAIPSTTPDASTSSARAGHGAGGGGYNLHHVQTNGTDKTGGANLNGGADSSQWADVNGSNGHNGSDVFVSHSGGGGGGSEKEGHQPRVYETHVQGQQQQGQQQGHSSIMGHGVGSVRKRLSILRLGKKSSKERGMAGGLGGVDEE